MCTLMRMRAACCTPVAEDALLQPHEVVLPNGLNVKDVDAGGRKDSGHTAFVDAAGGLWTCGCDR